MVNKMKLQIQHAYDTSDGELCIFIDTDKYSYFLDSALIPKILKQMQRQPGKALDRIKKAAKFYYKHEAFK